MFLFLKLDLGRISQKSLLQQDDAGYFSVKNPDDSIQILLRKRNAQPYTYCHAIASGVFHLGYGNSNNVSLDDEYLHIAMRNDGHLTVTRDVYCTLPLFYAFEGDQLVVSNSFEKVASELKTLTLDPLVFNLHIGGKAHFRKRTKYKEVSSLEELEVLELSPGAGLRVRQGPNRPWFNNLDGSHTDPKDFLNVFEKSLNQFITNRLAGENIAFAISGGLDSSTLPLYIAKRWPQAVMLGVTKRFSGIDGATQASKLEAIRKATAITIIDQELLPEVNGPLQRVLNDQGKVQYRSIPTFLETYRESTEHFCLLLEQQGVSVFATGYGGDEIFEHFIDSSHLGLGSVVYQEYENNMPPYLTHKHREILKEFMAETTVSHQPLLPTMVHSSSFTHNNTYIDHGIWPISPFTTPSLVAFCQSLPVHYKANKNIMRAFHQAQGFPTEIYNPSTNESFQTFFEEALSQPAIRQIINEVLPISFAGKHGYIDTSLLLDGYTKAVEERNAAWLYQIYAWLCTEIDLQYHRDQLAARL